MAFTQAMLPATILCEENTSSLPLKSFIKPPASITNKAPAAKSQTFMPYPKNASSFPDATKARSKAVDPVLRKVSEFE